MSIQYKFTGTSNQFPEGNKLERISEKGDPLEYLNKAIDWEYLRPIIENMMNKDSMIQAFSKKNDSLLIFKILILQRYYNLSDSQIEYQILDRLSFCRFLNLSFNDQIPDEKTILSFRNYLIEMELEEELLILFERLLEKHNLKAYKGEIIDANFVKTPLYGGNSTDVRNLNEKRQNMNENSISFSLDIL